MIHQSSPSRLYRKNFVFQYTESYVPPRCRNPRKRVVDGNIVLVFPVLTTEQAPVAFYEIQETGRNIEYRFYQNQLWSHRNYSADGTDNGSSLSCFENVERITTSPYWTFDQHVKFINDNWQYQYIFVGDCVYKKIPSEPRLRILWQDDEICLQRNFAYLNGLGAKSYFSISRLDDALIAMQELQEKLKPDFPQVTICQNYYYQILMPDVLKLNPVKDAAKEYKQELEQKIQIFCTEFQNKFAAGEERKDVLHYLSSFVDK